MSSRAPIIDQDKDNINKLGCENLVLFQSKLNNIRKLDDKIINILNAEIPTQSFKDINPKAKCTQLNEELRDYYDSRENAIKKCIDYCKKEIDLLKSREDVPKSKMLDQRYKLKTLQEELGIETIVRARSLKAVEERCRQYV